MQRVGVGEREYDLLKNSLQDPASVAAMVWLAKDCHQKLKIKLPALSAIHG